MSDHDLARRAVASPHWRWMPGMLSRCNTDTRRAVYRWLVGLDTRHYGFVCIVQDKHGRPCRNVATLQPGPDVLPDLDDPATLGCLLALVRDAWKLPAAVWYPKNGGCCVGVGRMPMASGRIWTRANLAEALVAALEVAP